MHSHALFTCICLLILLDTAVAGEASPDAAFYYRGKLTDEGLTPDQRWLELQDQVSPEYSFESRRDYLGRPMSATRAGSSSILQQRGVD